MKRYVDRIESDRAVLQKESGEREEIALSALPEGAREGSMLEYADGAFRLAPAAEAERRKRLYARQQALKRKKKENKGE